MTNHELYINDYLIDVDQETGLTLLYESMLFKDMQSLISSRSTGFSFPKTANNLRAIKQSHLADITRRVGNFPQRNHKVDYYLNGVSIIQGGIGYLQDIGERINFVFTFGNIENTHWLNDKLADIGANPNDGLYWHSSTPLMMYGDSYGFPYVDFGQGLSETVTQYTHPAVSVNWIIDRIAQTHNIVIEKGNHFDGLHILLYSKNPNETSVEYDAVTGEASCYNSNLIHISNIESDNQGIYDAADKSFNMKNATRLELELQNFGGRITLREPNQPTIDCRISCSNIDLTEQFWGTTVVAHYVDTSTIWEDGNLVEYYNYELSVNESALFDVTADTKVQFFFGVVGVSLSESERYLKGQIRVSPKFTADIVFGGFYPIVENLPDMKQVEFLKSMMQLRGLFAYPKAKNTIGMVSCDDIAQNKNQAQGWTDKLITHNLIPNVPEGIKYTLDNFAQKNWMRWNNDDEVSSEITDTYFDVDSIFAEPERDTLKLLFSGTNNRVKGKLTYAYVPLYTEGENGEIKMNKLKPRVLMGSPEPIGTQQNVCCLSFEGLDMKTIKERYYKSYINIVSVPRVITASFRLTELDLYTLDLTKPIYLEQFGHHYMILRLQAPPNRLCKTELIEI